MFYIAQVQPDDDRLKKSKHVALLSTWKLSCVDYSVYNYKQTKASIFRGSMQSSETARRCV